MKVIKYFRVSTQKQGRSGLGLEAQEAAVDRFLTSINAEIVGRYVEVESGGSKDKISINKEVTIDSLLKKRPVLLKAVREAQATGATIVVKEASRLSRFSLLIDYLIAARVHFICSDNPTDDELFIKMRTLFAEEELKKISERTKRALDARKARGHSLGKPDNFSNEGRAKGSQKMKELAQSNDTNRQVLKIILADRKLGKTFKSIADELNSLGFKTPRGKEFKTGTVSMLVKTYD